METESLALSGKTTANSKRRIRLRGMQAACGVALLEAVPGGLELARLVGVDPLNYARRQMLLDLGIVSNPELGAPRADNKMSRRASTQVTLGVVGVATRVLKGTRYAGAVVKRAGLLVTVVVSVTSAIGAYRQVTEVGFAALGVDPAT